MTHPPSFLPSTLYMYTLYWENLIIRRHKDVSSSRRRGNRRYYRQAWYYNQRSSVFKPGSRFRETGRWTETDSTFWKILGEVSFFLTIPQALGCLGRNGWKIESYFFMHMYTSGFVLFYLTSHCPLLLLDFCWISKLSNHRKVYLLLSIRIYANIFFSSSSNQRTWSPKRHFASWCH